MEIRKGDIIKGPLADHASTPETALEPAWLRGGKEFTPIPKEIKVMDASEIEGLLNEDESASLDFKRDQYPFENATDEQKSEMLKDILAFANAWRRTDAYILIGVEEVKGGRSKPVGVSTHLDDAKLQQFVNSKTNRPVTFSYTAFPIDQVEIGIIIVPVQDRPFYLVREYGRLTKNQVYIRRGSSTAIATPDEIFKMGATSQHRGQPKLSVVARVLDSRKPEIVIGIRNEAGSGPARGPYLSFQLPEGFTLATYRLDGNRNDGLPERPQPGCDWRTPTFAGDAGVIIHPGTTHEVTRIERQGQELSSGTAEIEYEVAAENAEMSRGVTHVSW